MAKTYGEVFKEAMACKTPEEGEVWLQGYAEELFREFPEKVSSVEHAKRQTKENIAYFAGYYTRAEADHIFEIFGAVHPIFGG